MKIKILIYSILIVFTSSFSQNKFGGPEVNPLQIQSNFKDWNLYQTKNIFLSTDFVAIDLMSKPISKENFLKQLLNGKLIPIRLKSNDNEIIYQLFKIQKKSDSSINATISQIAFDEYEHFKMENTDFPKFNFTDLNRNLITNESLKGKIIVIKCWYIHCASCIKEFPAVNKLSESYKDRKDIVFMSFAEDNEEQLITFLARKPLSYSVVPNMKEYMNNTLKLNAFPTHFIINKEGKIAKVVSNVESLEKALELELKK